MPNWENERDEKIGAMKSRSAQLLLTIICFILGLLLVAQFRTQRIVSGSILSASSADQLVIISSLVENNAHLREEMETLEGQLDEYQRATGRAVLESLVEELNKVRIINGLVEVSGSGVEVSLDWPIGVLDMQDLINELRGSSDHQWGAADPVLDDCQHRRWSDDRQWSGTSATLCLAGYW